MANPEYIVVGSGAGGGPLAARLAELGHSVLLLEAGGDDAPWTYPVPVFHGLATEDEAMRLDHYVRHYADETRQERDPKYRVERDQGRTGVYYPRARTLGGCTAHYAMIIIRPHDSDWQAIRDATGDASWDPRKMDEYFTRIERCCYRGPGGGHGKEGWLPTSFPSMLEFAGEIIEHRDSAIASIVAEATEGLSGINGARDPLIGARSALSNVVRRVAASAEIPDIRDPFDPNDRRVLDERETGLLFVPTAIDEKGRRAGTRERIREAEKTGRLEVRLHCHVTELVFDPQDRQRVIGVRYLRGERLYRADRDSGRFGSPDGLANEEVLAEREVILSAGAFITPQLLMLSGIGPRAELESLGIAVRKDLPGVGKNLQDRYEVGIVARAVEPFGVLSDATFGLPTPDALEGDSLYKEWKEEGEGVYATNGSVLGFIEKSSVAEHGEPDCFVFGLPGKFDGYHTGWSRGAVARPYDKWTWLLLKAHTRARGRVTLKTKDPLDPPHVDFNYFERDGNGAPTAGAVADLAAMREGVQFIRKLIDNSKVLSLHPEIMKDVDLTTEAGIDAFVQDRAWGHHASCTCKIGADDDPEAVLDSSFRVRGVKGLRVVDASVFPRIPGFFVVMPTYMISEKAADVIHEEAQGAFRVDAGQQRSEALLTNEARKISLWDDARLQLLLTVPTSLRGLAAPNPLFVGLLCRLNAVEWTARILSELRRKYGSDHLWAWFPFGRTLLVLDRQSIECVLQSEKNQADPFLKKYGLSRFLPEGVIISSGSEWQERRRFNEAVLDFGKLHCHAEAFKEIVFREVDQMASYLVGTLRWIDFQQLANRISHQVILGSGQVNPALAQGLDRMVTLSNWFLRSSRFRGFYEEIERYLARERSVLQRSGVGPDGNAPAAACLMRDSAAELEAGRANPATHVPHQIGFWFTVLKDAVELHVARTLALIAVHPEVQDRVRREVANAGTITAEAIDGLQYLGACIGEQLRLWTPVSVLLRRVVEPLTLPAGITVEAGKKILLHPGFYHRDPAVFGELANRFAPDEVDESFPPVYFFSGHRQSCAGQFLARFVLKATLAALLARFRFELVAPGIDTTRIPSLYNHLAIELRAIRDA